MIILHLLLFSLVAASILICLAVDGLCGDDGYNLETEYLLNRSSNVQSITENIPDIAIDDTRMDHSQVDKQNISSKLASVSLETKKERIFNNAAMLHCVASVFMIAYSMYEPEKNKYFCFSIISCLILGIGLQNLYQDSLIPN